MAKLGLVYAEAVAEESLPADTSTRDDDEYTSSEMPSIPPESERKS